MLRVASSTVVPIALRAIASPRILSGSIAHAFIDSDRDSIVKRETPFIHSHHFTTDVKKKLLDRKLVKILKSEIKANQLSMEKTMPEAPAAFPFTIQDDPRERNINLTRELVGEKIDVLVYLRQIIPVDVEEESDFSDDDNSDNVGGGGGGSGVAEDNSSTDHTNSNEREKSSGGGDADNSSPTDSNSDKEKKNDNGGGGGTAEDSPSKDTSSDEKEKTSDGGGADNSSPTDSSKKKSAADNSNSSTTESQSAESKEKSTAVPAPSVGLCVKISKENGKQLEFGVSASSDDITIDRMTIIETAEDQSNNQSSFGQYSVDLDRELQLAFREFLEFRGIKKCYVGFLYEYMVRKNKQHPMLALNELKKFMKK